MITAPWIVLVLVPPALVCAFGLGLLCGMRIVVRHHQARTSARPD